MLRHLVDELHLDLTPDFISFVAHNKLGDLLVTHICGSVDFSRKVFDVSDAILVRKFKTRLEKR